MRPPSLIPGAHDRPQARQQLRSHLRFLEPFITESLLNLPRLRIRLVRDHSAMQETPSHIGRDLEVISSQEHRGDLRHRKLGLSVHLPPRPGARSQKRIQGRGFQKPIAVIKENVRRPSERLRIEDLPPILLILWQRLHIAGADRRDDRRLCEQRLARSHRVRAKHKVQPPRRRPQQRRRKHREHPRDHDRLIARLPIRLPIPKWELTQQILQHRARLIQWHILCKLHPRVLRVSLRLRVIPIRQQLDPPILPPHRLPHRRHPHQLPLPREKLITLQDRRRCLHRDRLRLLLENIRLRHLPFESHQMLLAVSPEPPSRHLHQPALRRYRHRRPLPHKDPILAKHPADLPRHSRDHRHDLHHRHLRIYLQRRRRRILPMRHDSIFRQLRADHITNLTH